MGLTIFDLIVAAGALLFAVILDHNAIRDAVESQGLAYLEYFPLILDCLYCLGGAERGAARPARPALAPPPRSATLAT